MNGLSKLDELKQWLEEHGITDVNTDYDEPLAKYNIFNLMHSDYVKNGIGHAIMVHKLSETSYYYFDSFTGVSETVLNRVCPDNCNILCNMDELQKIKEESCGWLCVREIVLIESGKLDIVNYIVLSKDNLDYEVIYSSLNKKFNKKNHDRMTKIEDELIH